MENLFVVEHCIADKEAWAVFLRKWNDILGAEDMTIDKALAHPEWEGNSPLLSIPDSSGSKHFCIWKMPVSTTKEDFQAFIDRFVCGTCTNKIHAVQETVGASGLTSRGFMRDWINAAQGKDSPGFLDMPQMWAAFHTITDKNGWEKEVMGGLARDVREKCNTPSDVASLFPKEIGATLVLFFDNDTAMCFDGSVAGLKRNEYQKMADELSKGCATNTIYSLNPQEGVGVMYLSSDTCHQETITWAEKYVSPTTKTASHEGTDPVKACGHHLASQ